MAQSLSTVGRIGTDEESTPHRRQGGSSLTCVLPYRECKRKLAILEGGARSMARVGQKVEGGRGRGPVTSRATLSTDLGQRVAWFIYMHRPMVFTVSAWPRWPCADCKGACALSRARRPARRGTGGGRTEREKRVKIRLAIYALSVYGVGTNAAIKTAR